MKIIDKINAYLINPHIINKRARFSHYPSEASIISRVDGKIIGKCHRASWYNWKGMTPTNPVDARGEWTFETANKIEESYIDLCKKLGIWAGDHVKFYDQEHNISGEADLFIFDDNKMVGVEIKTAYGYGYQQVITKFPKIENLLQVAIYLDYFTDISEWHLIYKARDTQEDVEYNITIKSNEDVRDRYLVVDTSPVFVFYIYDIYERYRQLGEYVLNNTMPPRDYMYGYVLEESESRCSRGEISKQKLSSVKNGKTTDSDWQCLYCSFLNLCWPKKRAAIGTDKLIGEISE